MSYYFQVISKLGRTIRTTNQYWNKIITIKHPIMTGQEEKVIETLKKPLVIRKSEKDANVCLYYRKYIRRYICAVVRHENGTGYLISAYPVDKIKKGVIIYEKNKSIL